MHRATSTWRGAVACAGVLLLVTTSWAIPAGAGAASRPRLPRVSAVLMDAETGQFLFARAADKRRQIASTTKIMTAIVVTERADMDATVTVAPGATKVGESSAELIPRERRTVRELLYATMLKSANDAATALSIFVGRSVRGFASMMNEKARVIGARRTHFANPHGLTAPRHYSTARDLALMAAYGLKNPMFARVVRAKKTRIPWPKHPYPRIFTNHNKLLWSYRGAIGVKTGYTVLAGNCLVAAARRGSTTLVVVVLGASSADEAYKTAGALLNYGFSGYKWERLLTKGARYGEMSIPELAGERVGLVASRSVRRKVFADAGPVTVTAVVSRQARLPISRGEFLGEAQVRQRKRVLDRVPLMADRDVDAPNLWDRLVALCSARAHELGYGAASAGAAAR